MCGGVSLLLKAVNMLVSIKSPRQRVRDQLILTAEGFLQPAELHGSPVRREPDVVQVRCRGEVLK